MALAEIHPEVQPGSPESLNLTLQRPSETPRGLFLPGDIEYQTLTSRVIGGSIHRYVSMEVEGFSHHGWYTPADPEQDSGTLLVAKAGLGEVVHDGIGLKLHTRLAGALPSMSVFSHETDAIGKYGSRLSFSDLLSHGLDQMSEQGLELLKRFGEDKRVVLLATSMGTVIVNKLLLHNLEQDQPVDVAGVVNLAPALVDPSRVPVDMFLRFTPSLVMDLAKEVAITDLRHMGGYLLTLLHSRPRLRDTVPFSKQIFDLLHGTPMDEIEEAIAAYNTSVIVGNNDPVGQPKMWRELAENHDSLDLHVLTGKGHGIAAKPYESSRKISSIIQGHYL